MGVRTVALYDASDRESLHVRLADECVQLPSHHAFMDVDRIIAIAREQGADAINPGYGFLAENAAFIHACDAAGIAFIGPPAEVIEAVHYKIGALDKARAAGFPDGRRTDCRWLAARSAARQIPSGHHQRGCSRYNGC